MHALALLLLAAAPSPAPLTAQEKADFQGAPCKTFNDALKAAMVKVPKSASPAEKDAALKAALTRPETEKPAEWNRCLDLFERGMLDYKAATIEIEAKMGVKQLGSLMKLSFEEAKKLCPSSKNPVPADLKLISPGPWASTQADWSDPAWACLGYSPPPSQRFQYEVKSDAKAQTFEVFARGYPRGDSTLVTWSVSGKVVNGQLELGEPTKK